jgi:hypothetical protein
MIGAVRNGCLGVEVLSCAAYILGPDVLLPGLGIFSDCSVDRKGCCLPFRFLPLAQALLSFLDPRSTCALPALCRPLMLTASCSFFAPLFQPKRRSPSSPPLSSSRPRRRPFSLSRRRATAYRASCPDSPTAPPPATSGSTSGRRPSGS